MKLITLHQMYKGGFHLIFRLAMVGLTMLLKLNRSMNLHSLPKYVVLHLIQPYPPLLPDLMAGYVCDQRNQVSFSPSVFLTSFRPLI